MKSAITGDSGRTYTDGEVLRRHPEDKKFDIYKAKFVLLYEKRFLC